MLSGSRPRGNSSTPVSGKIGRIEGSAVPPMRSLIPVSPSGKHLRGEPPSAAQSQRIGWPHGLEEFDELLARSLLVPLAIALEQGQQLVDCGLPLAAAKECGGELEARLVIIGVRRQASAQFARPGHRLVSLFGKLERRASRGDLGVSCTLFGYSVEELARLSELAARDHRLSVAGERFDIRGVALQDLRIERPRTLMVARLQRLLGHRQGFFDWRGAAFAATDALDKLLDLALRQRPDKAVDRPAVLEGVDGGD